jgi:hypothetical protein
MSKSREKVVAKKALLITIGLILSVLWTPLLFIAIVGILIWIAFN